MNTIKERSDRDLLLFCELSCKPEVDRNIIKAVVEELRCRLNKQDSLDEVISHQRMLNKKVIPPAINDIKNLDHATLMYWLRNFAVAAQIELSEFLVECQFKWWKQVPFNVELAKEEAIDVFHFLLCIFIFFFKFRRRISFNIM